MPVHQAGFLVRRLDRSLSPAAVLAPRHLRAGQAAAAAPPTGVAAVLLAARGLDVLVVEKEAAPGGKMREVAAGGASLGEIKIDAGPTVFTMRWVFEEIFAAVGVRLDEHLTLTRSRVLAGTRPEGWTGRVVPEVRPAELVA